MVNFCKEDLIRGYENLWRKVTREGVEDLLEWLKKGDFYDAPCSTQYHLAEAHGLVTHSINVYDAIMRNARDLFKTDYVKLRESLAIVALAHDFCKIGFYTQEMRNVKEDGVWVQKPFYKVKDQFPFGHGEKSVYILNKFLKLTPEEALAIRWHMAGFAVNGDYGNGQALAAASRQTILVPLLQMADIEATYIIETLEKEEDAECQD